jgi:anti-anti-sigma regulatory factor
MSTTVAESGSSLVELEGVFDGPAARRLEALLARSGPGTRIRVDLSKVREFHDFAIGVLAYALARTAVQVELSGLRHHQARMLRYFGATLQSSASPDAA